MKIKKIIQNLVNMKKYNPIINITFLYKPNLNLVILNDFKLALHMVSFSNHCEWLLSLEL